MLMFRWLNEESGKELTLRVVATITAEVDDTPVSVHRLDANKQNRKAPNRCRENVSKMSFGEGKH